MQLGDDDDDDGSVIVSSGVRIAAAGGHGPGGDGSEDEDEDDDNDSLCGGRGSERIVARLAEEPPARGAPARQQQHDDAAAPQNEDLNSMSWWDILTPAQQRSMAQRLMVATPMAPPAPQTVVMPARGQKPKRKTLKIDDFKGEPDESVEAWLASVLEEVKNQEFLGGDTWTADELFRGAVQHLKGKAQRWYLSLTETMRPEDNTFAFLVKRMRGKYGRRENAWQVQQRLAKRVQQPGERLRSFADSLLAIGFSKKVSAETYIEAFLNGMNNEVMATHVRSAEPQTLEEAVQYAEDKCGEYGEGRKVTDWKVAQQRYRGDRDLAGEDDGGRKRKETRTGMSQSDWQKLGLGFGMDENTPPVFDTSGKPVSGLAKSAKKDPLSLAALQALTALIGVGKIAETETKPAASKSKARALEVKAERVEAEDEGRGPVAAAPAHDWSSGGSGGPGGRGYGRRWPGGRGRDGGSGRGYPTGRYGPDTRPIAQRKAETECSYCGQRGHWWKECPVRAAPVGEPPAPQPAAAAAAAPAPAATAAASGRSAASAAPAAAAAQQGNERRQ